MYSQLIEDLLRILSLCVLVVMLWRRIVERLYIKIDLVSAICVYIHIYMSYAHPTPYVSSGWRAVRVGSVLCCSGAAVAQRPLARFRFVERSFGEPPVLSCYCIVEVNVERSNV